MNLNQIFVMSAVMFASQLAFAGSVSGGGGKAVVCRSRAGAVKSVELLDLWEAKVIYNRNVVSSSQPTHRQVEEGLDRIKHAIATHGVYLGTGTPRGRLNGAEAFREILKFDTDRLQLKNLPQIRWLKGIRLKLSEDSFESVMPEACAIEQVVRYDDTATGGEVYIDQDLYEKMDNTNQAALLLHEAFYAYLRRSSEKSSLRVRRAIGLVFSNHQFKSLESILPDDLYVCQGHLNSVVFYHSTEPFGVERIVSQILIADGRPRIDFDTPTSGWGGFKSFEDFLSTPSIGHYTHMGRSTGIDYSVNWMAGASTTGPKTLRMQMAQAPDQSSPSPEVTLECSPMKKSEFLNH